MQISAGTAFHIAHLFQFILQGEKLAFDCARQQARLCTNPRHKKFLVHQARQEHFHIVSFKLGAKLLRSKHSGVSLGQKPMQSYRRLIEEALKRGDFTETIIGMQIILEGLADVLLEKMDTGATKHGMAYKQVRRIILGQEDAHHTFGLRYLDTMLANAELPVYLKQRAADYLALSDEFLLSAQSLFEYFDEDVEDYRHAFRDSIPSSLIQVS